MKVTIIIIIITINGNNQVWAKSLKFRLTLGTFYLFVLW
jgi:hypothetical protein